MVYMAYRYPITEEMLSPILDILTANLDKILPILIGIFGLMLCIRVIPPLFAHVMGR